MKNFFCLSFLFFSSSMFSIGVLATEEVENDAKLTDEQMGLIEDLIEDSLTNLELGHSEREKLSPRLQVRIDRAIERIGSDASNKWLSLRAPESEILTLLADYIDQKILGLSIKIINEQKKRKKNRRLARSSKRDILVTDSGLTPSAS